MVIYNLSDSGVSVEVPSDSFKINEVRGYVLADSGDGLVEQVSQSALDSMFGSSSAESSSDNAAKEIKEVSVKGQTVSMPAYSAIVLK